RERPGTGELAGCSPADYGRFPRLRLSSQDVIAMLGRRCRFAAAAMLRGSTRIVPVLGLLAVLAAAPTARSADQDVVSGPSATLCLVEHIGGLEMLPDH